MADGENNLRKVDHINLVSENDIVDRKANYFDSIRLVHRALPEINYESVDTSTEFLGKKLSFPLLISAMTGGEDKKILEINKNLAMAAEECKVAMSVGSQRVAFDSVQARKSFELRKYAPTTLLFANLGAVQLNYGFGIKECREVISMLDADALVFHLNPLQELIQTNGNTNFEALISKIQTIADAINVPVILKEVGNGISLPDVELARRHGIEYFDVAGSGGTSWSLIEHLRNLSGLGDEKNASQYTDINRLGEVFADWGIPTPQILADLATVSGISLIASGGIRSGIDIAKATILGAKLSGIAKPFLTPAMASSNDVSNLIGCYKEQYKMTMFLTSMKKTESLFRNDQLILN